MKSRYCLLAVVACLSACSSEPPPPTDSAIAMRTEVAVHLLMLAFEKCDAVQLSTEECYTYAGALSSRQSASKFLAVAITQYESAEKYCTASRNKDFCEKIQSESIETYQSPTRTVKE